MHALRCHVFRGLPKELEEEVNKFLEVTPCHVAARGAERVRESRHTDHDLRARHAATWSDGRGSSCARQVPIHSDPGAKTSSPEVGLARRSDLTVVPDTRDRVTALYGDRLLPPLGAAARLSSAGQLVKESALGLLLVDATLAARDRAPATARTRSAPRSRRSTERVRTRVSREVGEDMTWSPPARSRRNTFWCSSRGRATTRSSSCTTCRGWPRSSRSYVALWLKRVVYPYLHERARAPDRHGLRAAPAVPAARGADPPADRDARSPSARFERERRRRDRAAHARQDPARGERHDGLRADRAPGVARGDRLRGALARARGHGPRDAARAVLGHR